MLIQGDTKTKISLLQRYGLILLLITLRKNENHYQTPVKMAMGFTYSKYLLHSYKD